MRPGLKHGPNGDDGVEGGADAVVARLLFPASAITARAGSALAEVKVDKRADLRRTMPVALGLARRLFVPVALVVVCIGVAGVAATVILSLTVRADDRPVRRAPFEGGSVPFILTCFRITDWRRPHFPALPLGAPTVEDAVEVRHLAPEPDSIFRVRTKSGGLVVLLVGAEQLAELKTACDLVIGPVFQETADAGAGTNARKPDTL